MIKAFNGHEPAIHSSCFVAENATVIGDVTLCENASVECLMASTSWRLRKIALFSFKKIINYLKENRIDITFMIFLLILD